MVRNYYASKIGVQRFLHSADTRGIVTDIVRSHVTGRRNLPFNLYQIQTKFRDEIRPRFGVMRAREFIMKDAYSFDLNEKA